MNNLRNLIKNSRVKKKLTQQQLADMVGCGRNHLSKVETGDTAASGKLLEKLFDALDITHKFNDDASNHLVDLITENLKWLTTDDLELITELVRIKSEKNRMKSRFSDSEN
jgi:transcriptional regulator with XRE-family HTH domain